MEARYATMASAKTHRPDANLAVISVNGTFAAREARQALENDLNVMLFSDNVSLDDELALKQLAHQKGLLMMGPDCGTAIINGAALCFGNAVRRGPDWYRRGVRHRQPGAEACAFMSLAAVCRS